MTLTVGSLFSGIGGIDLGLERAGMRVVWQAETDPYAARVLAKHWPHVPNLGDVTEVNWHDDALMGTDGIAHSLHVDVLAGGFPCQPVSVAGRRRRQEDHRWLWPEFARAVRDLGPRYVIVENVPGLLVGGMGDVLGDLADLGYDAEWDCLSAASVGAPHLRRRIFIVAHAQSPGREARGGDAMGTQPRPEPRQPPRQGRSGDVAHAVGVAGPSSLPRRMPTGPPSPGGGDRTDGRGSGLGDHWTAEPGVGRVAHGVPHRVDRLRCLGNAVVPQVAEYVGRRILEAAA